MEKQQIITHLNFARGFRGGERQTLLLIQELSKRGYKQRLCTRKNSVLTDKASKMKNLQVISISKPFLLSLKKVRDSGIIHAHETKGAQFAYFSYLRFAIPYIITRRVAIPIKKVFFNRQMYKNSLTTIALSNAIKNELLQVSKDIKCRIIPDSSGNLKADAEKLEKLKKRFEGKFVIGNIGELEPSKGQYYLIEAAKNLSMKYPNMIFLILGKGVDENNFRLQAQDFENILFEGFVNNVADYIAIFDLFVFPSLHEGFGSSLLDVMQKGVPIIASNVGGIPEIIKHNENGILINPKNVNEIEKAVEMLYKNTRFCQQLSQRSKLISQQYTVEEMARNYLEIYHYL